MLSLGRLGREARKFELTGECETGQAVVRASEIGNYNNKIFPQPCDDTQHLEVCKCIRASDTYRKSCLLFNSLGMLNFRVGVLDVDRMSRAGQLDILRFCSSAVDACCVLQFKVRRSVVIAPLRHQSATRGRMVAAQHF